MRISAAATLCILLISCSTTGEQQRQNSLPGPPPPSPAAPPPPPTAVKENMSLIGSVVRSIQLTDSALYVVEVDLRTAVPVGTGASLAEPGQTLRLQPSFSDNAERNHRLLAVRSLKEGDFLLGRIFLDARGLWRLYDTTLSEP